MIVIKPKLARSEVNSKACTYGLLYSSTDGTSDRISEAVSEVIESCGKLDPKLCKAGSTFMF